jgi:hypothetical protein
MVIVVPRILPTHLVPLGLGIHKSMEMASSTIMQTLSGVWLDHDEISQSRGGYEAGAALLRVFWVINLLQLGCVVWLYWLERKRRSVEVYQSVPMCELGAEADFPVEAKVQPSSAVGRSERERVGRGCISGSVWGLYV